MCTEYCFNSIFGAMHFYRENKSEDQHLDTTSKYFAIHHVTYVLASFLTLGHARACQCLFRPQGSHYICV
uniref:Uncharacterized protein n=1 Tax=Anguilla anguilla TaxID=7936 RepID=A0A0E9WR29_ANGAN